VELAVTLGYLGHIDELMIASNINWQSCTLHSELELKRFSRVY